MKEVLDQIRAEYIPKDGYTFHMGVTDDNSLLGAVYKKIEVKSKRGTSDTAECSVFNARTKSKEEFIRVFNDYITKRV